MKAGRRPPRTRFTPTMWTRWLTEQPWAKVPPDHQTLRLRAGIQEFRAHLAEQITEESQR